MLATISDCAGIQLVLYSDEAVKQLACVASE